MRDISAANLALITQATGTEPINIVGIEWSYGTEHLYYDRVINFGVEDGRILELGNLNNVIRVDGSGSADTITLKLDDSDGALKSIYDTIDIHKRRAVVYQAFILNGIQVSEKFQIFEGQITSPIVWSEGERTLSFSISSKVEDREVGFAPEDGQFIDLPVDLIGKAWPIVVGTGRYIPAIPLRRPPTSILYTPFGIPDPGILEQIARLEKQGRAPITPPLLQTGYGPGLTTEEVNDIIASNQAALTAYGDSMMEAGATVVTQIEELKQVFLDQEKWLPGKEHTPKELQVDMTNIGQGSYIVKINETVFKATFTLDPGSNLGKMTLKIPPVKLHDPESYTLTKMNDINDNWFGARNADGFSFFSVGSQIVVISEFPIVHIVSSNTGTVEGVYAYRNFDGIKKLAKVPTTYYTLQRDYITGVPIYDEFSQNPNANTQDKAEWFGPMGIVLTRPLSITSYINQRNKVLVQEHLQDLIEKYDADTPSKGSKIEHVDEWEDQLYVSVVSNVNPNPARVIEWFILNFSSYGVDEMSFNIAAGHLQNYPMDFVLFEKKNLVQLINELAVQARCAVWLKDFKFYIRYLSTEPQSVGTIDDDDIEVGSLQLLSTETEDIVTKYVATYRTNYLPTTEENKVIIRHNIPKYGTQEEQVDYYAYQTHYAVKKSASFWIIRKANTWKRIQFRTFLHKLKLETMDAVTVNLTMASVCDQAVKGIVESSVYDSANNVIEMTIWLPVLLGKTIPYNFAWPADVDVTEVFPGSQDITAEGGGGFIGFQPRVIGRQSSTSSPDSTAGGHNPDNLNDERRTINSFGRPDTMPTALPSDQNDSLVFSDYYTPGGVESQPTPTWDYNLRDASIPPPEFEPSSSTSSVYPGFVTGGSGNEYQVNIFPHGLDEESINVNAKQLQIAGGETIPSGTGVLVAKVRGQYYMQVPVWL